jgi:hypothetical protein
VGSFSRTPKSTLAVERFFYWTVPEALGPPLTSISPPAQKEKHDANLGGGAALSAPSFPIARLRKPIGSKK